MLTTSDPMLATGQDSSTVTTRLVFLTEFIIVSESKALNFEDQLLLHLSQNHFSKS